MSGRPHVILRPQQIFYAYRPTPRSFEVCSTFRPVLLHRSFVVSEALKTFQWGGISASNMTSCLLDHQTVTIGTARYPQPERRSKERIRTGQGTLGRGKEGIPPRGLDGARNSLGRYT